MRDETRKKQRHIDCEWLIETEKGVFKCHDSRSAVHTQPLTLDDVMREACQFFHPSQRDLADARIKQ